MLSTTNSLGLLARACTYVRCDISSILESADKPLVWLRGEIKTPPFSSDARVEAGILLRRLQQGESLSMPHARPMPIVGRRCLELRVPDAGVTWRIICRLDADVVVVADVFQKTTPTTHKRVIDDCKRRLRMYDQIMDTE